jgi:predicted peptidase
MLNPHVILVTLSFVSTLAVELVAGEQQPRTLEADVRVSMNYLLHLPTGYENQESWPLILFLHGAGERGDDIELVKKHGPPKLVSEGNDFPFIIVSPQCPKERWWQPTELSALLDEIVKQHRVDENRIYVTGLSMGGFGTWSLAFYSPDRFAAIAPICGGGEAYWAKRFKKLPAWIFHGAKDTGVPLERSESMMAAMQKEEGDVRLTVYPEAGHDSWTETYNNPKLYEWFLEHRRVKDQ